MRSIQNWIQGYMEYTKELEAPTNFHLWAAVGTIAGVLRGKVWIDMGYFKWKPNFFIIYVAKPGIVAKSTAVGVGMGFLREIKGIHFGPDSATWQALTESFVNATELYEWEGKQVPMSSLTIAASELGTFLDPRNREMIDVLVDLWDGREVPWTRRTKGSGEETIPAPWLNFIGCTTPSWIAENFPEYAIGGGFTSRTIFVYADEKRHYNAYPGDNMTTDFDVLRTSLISDLQKISKITGQYNLTDGAKEWGTLWYKEHWTKKHPHLEGDRFGGYLARKQTHIHKVAMVLAAATRDEAYITEDDLQTADNLVTSTEYTLGFVFSNISDNREAKFSSTLIGMFQIEPKITKQNLWRKVVSFMSHEAFELTLSGLIHAGYVKTKQVGDVLQLQFYEREMNRPVPDKVVDKLFQVESPSTSD